MKKIKENQTFLCPGDIEREHFYGNILFFSLCLIFWIGSGCPPFNE